MKYIIVLGDGMADEPMEELEGKTPLAHANTPTINELSQKAEIGLARTIPPGMNPGSDTANLAVLGYDPKIYYSGRSPLEALSIGVDMKDTDVALRCNIVTLSDDGLPYEEKTILDHCSDEINTEDASILLEAVKKEIQNETYQFYTGTSYRHLTIWNQGRTVTLTPPHDILGKKIDGYLPEEKLLKEMMEKSFTILNEHPINKERVKKGLNKANSFWFWGAGTKPALDSFEKKYGKKGVMISAVDLLKGIAVGAGLKNIIVEGANGTLHTNYEGKAMAAVNALLKDGYDFAYIHVEAPDEMGHQGSLERKIKAIENIDSRVIAPLKKELEKAGADYRLLFMPDHPTPIAMRTHTDKPVPYLLYDSTRERRESWEYNEADAAESGNYIEHGYMLMNKLFENA